MFIKTGKVIKCDFCGKEIYRKTSEFDKHTNHFCSISCEGKFRKGTLGAHWQGGKIDIKCYICGKSIKVPKWYYKTIKMITCGSESCKHGVQQLCGLKNVKSRNYKNIYKTGIYKKNFMKSSWEIAFAKHLDKNNILWFYEPKYFRLEKLGHSYVPDFYLPDFDLYVEVKAYLDEKNRAKLFAFRKLGYKLKLIGVGDKKIENFLISINKFTQQIKKGTKKWD